MGGKRPPYVKVSWRVYLSLCGGLYGSHCVTRLLRPNHKMLLHIPTISGVGELTVVTAVCCHLINKHFKR